MPAAALLALFVCAPFDASHGAWSALLGRRVSDGWVDYAGWKRADQGALAGYLGSLEQVDRACFERFSERERLAFWINAYNAYTVRLILDHYPVKSIRSIGFLPMAAFRSSFIHLHAHGGGALSLNEMEHQILRKQFAEPRIHFAINCASKSCPQLRGEAYRAADLDAQLDDATRRFLLDRTKNRYDPTTRTLSVSSIFKWFHEDFEHAAGTVQGFVGRWLDGAAGARKIEYLDYDWSLNGN